MLHPWFPLIRQGWIPNNCLQPPKGICWSICKSGLTEPSGGRGQKRCGYSWCKQIISKLQTTHGIKIYCKPEWCLKGALPQWAVPDLMSSDEFRRSLSYQSPQSISRPKWSQVQRTLLRREPNHMEDKSPLQHTLLGAWPSRGDWAVLRSCDVCSNTNHVVEGSLSVDGVIGYKMVLRCSSSGPRQHLSCLVTDGPSAVSHQVAQKGSTSVPLST